MAGRAPVLRVYPDADRVEQALVEAAAREGFADASGFLTFAQLIQRCEPVRQLGRRPGAPLASRVVLWSLGKALPAGPFGGFVQEPAFARAALELIFDLKSGSCSPDELAQAVESLPPSRQERGRFLAELYRRYERRMEELRLADREDLLRGAREAVQRGLPQDLAGVRAVEVRDLYDFTPLRLGFLLALAERCRKEGIQLTLSLPGAGAAAIDGLVDAVLSQLERHWSVLELDAEKSVPQDRPLSVLGEQLFASQPLADQAALPLTAFSAGSSRDEARQLARRARELVDQGTPPEEIAIAFRDLSSEAEAVAENLEELGVPARIRLGAPLASTWVGRLALELPLLAEEGFTAQKVARYLESRYAPEVSSGAPWSVGSVLALAAVRDDRVGASGERGAYQVRLEKLASRAERTGRTELARVARAVRDRAEELIQLAGRLGPEGTASQLLESWWGAVEALGLFRAVRAGERGADEGSALGREVVKGLARDQAAAEALRELALQLEGALKLSGAGREKMSRRTFSRWLQDSALDFNLEPRGPRSGAVRILELRGLVAGRFSHVMIGGMVEGRLPGRGRVGSLFSEEDRKQVNAALGREVFRLCSGEGEGRVPFRLAEDRLLFYLGLTAATRSAALSFARRSQEGQEQLPSPFLDELSRVAALQIRPLPLEPVPSLEEIQSESQLRERTALECLARPELRTTAPDPARSALAQRFGEEPWYRAAVELTAIEEERLRFFSDPRQPPGPFSGDAGAPSTLESLRQRFELGPQRPASASMLGRFGNCAFQGFLAYALGLEEPETPGEELDPRGRGSFWHKVMELLFPRLREEGLLGRSPEEWPELLLDQVVGEAAEDLERRGHTGHPALWQLGQERARAMARRVLSAELRGLPFPELLPGSTELAFGKAGAPPGWEEVVLPPAAPTESPLHLAGAIDRLDHAPGGLGVVDYKSSRSKSARQQLEALLTTDYQLALYAYAASSRGGGELPKGAWLSLRDGGALSLEEVLSQAGQGVAELLDTSPEGRAEAARKGQKNLANAAQQLASELRRGKFPARPRDCANCPYRPVCRITLRRLPETDDA